MTAAPGYFLQSSSGGFGGSIAGAELGEPSRQAPITPRRFPTPWSVEQTPCGYKVLDASGQALAYIYARETKAEADTAKVLTFDEVRRVAVNVAKLAKLLLP